MRTISLAVLAALTVHSAGLSQAPDGRYACDHVGNWGCGAPPDGNCVDGGRPRHAPRHRLHVDFGVMRIRLNGLHGHLESGPNPGDYRVYWNVAGLGYPKLTHEDRDGVLVLHLIHEGSRSASMGEFRCMRGSAR